MKTKNEIINKIKILVEEATLERVKREDVKPEDKILSDLELDSLDYASILLACEQWMDIKVREEGVNWGAIRSVEELATFLESQQ